MPKPGIRWGPAIAEYLVEVTRMSTCPSVPVADADPQSRPGRAWPALSAFLHGPWFAYPMLALVQLRVAWSICRYKDLSSGDSSGYFIAAFRWFSSGKADVIFSPLYTMFYGSLMHITRDPYAVNILHRLVIV